MPPGLTITSETCITLRGGEKLQVNQADKRNSFRKWVDMLNRLQGVAEVAK